MEASRYGASAGFVGLAGFPKRACLAISPRMTPDDDQDGLTGLANAAAARTLLHDWLCESEARVHALLLVLGRFDSVNLAHGSDAGDYALTEVARRITHFSQDEFAPGEWFAARIEGGKFLLATREPCSRERWQFLAEALADTVFTVGTSARPRTAQRNYLRPRAVASRVVERADHGIVALVFGREDRGLTNEGLDLCNAIAIVPTAAEYSSLNLAQACLVLCYEIHLAATDDAPLPGYKRDVGPATRADLEEMYAALEQGFHRIDFFKGDRHPEAVLTTLRTLLSRAEPDLREVRLHPRQRRRCCHEQRKEMQMQGDGQSDQSISLGFPLLFPPCFPTVFPFVFPLISL